MTWESGVDEERLLPYLQAKDASPIKPSATEEALTEPRGDLRWENEETGQDTGFGQLKHMSKQ